MSSLVLNGESLDEVSLAGRCRTAAIKALCSMHPSRAAMVQSLSVANCKHPTLALSIALEAEERKMRYAQMRKLRLSHSHITINLYCV